jgi:hypothetical protein
MTAIKLTMKNLEGIGKGVFTESDIAAGTEVLQFQGDLKEVSDLEDLTHCLQVGESTFLTSAGGMDDFINHSCEPTCGVRLTPDQRVIVFALRDLKAGTEITFDYATTQSGEHETLRCLCKKPGCRKLIGGFRDLPKPLQEYYIRHDAVLPFLLSRPKKTASQR